MPLRISTRSDLSAISEILAVSFYDEELNSHIFPYRKQYPDDYLSAWRQKVVTDWWDYGKVWVVHYEEEKEDDTNPAGTITGVAQWARRGQGSHMLWERVRWWDPRRLISPFLSLFYTVRRFFIPNRASTTSTPTDINPLNKWNFGHRLWPFMARHFTYPPYRRNHWELCTLAVHPAWQGRGIGRDLVAWGLQRARADGLPVVVVAAKDTESFYQKCGFKYLVGYATTEEIEDDETNDGDGVGLKRTDVMNPAKARGIGGGAILWTELRDEEE